MSLHRSQARRRRRESLDVPSGYAFGPAPCLQAPAGRRGRGHPLGEGYVFYDLYQRGLGVCDLSDIAITVLAEVIGHRDEDGRPIVDAGSLALSEDRSTRAFDDDRDVTHGLVADEHGEPLAGDLLVAETSQEHGVLAKRDGEAPKLTLGDRVRIYPNHSCITAACYDEYVVVEDGEVVDEWPRVNGW